MYTCSFVHRTIPHMCIHVYTCVYMCAVWTFICMLRTHAQRAMALSSCLIQGNQVVKLKVHFHNNNLSRLTEVQQSGARMADFVWKWLKNQLPTVLVCLPDGANQGNKVVKHRDPTPHSNHCNRTNSHSGLLALIDKSNAKDLSRLYNKGKLVFSVLDSQVFLVLNQCCLQFA